MVQLPSHPGYSLNWSRGVVQSFNRKYVRATEAVKNFYAFDDEKVATWVADWPKRWQNYKMLVKQLDRWYQHHLKVKKACLLLNRCVVDALRMLGKNGKLHDFPRD